MKLLTKHLSSDFLKKFNYFEGANLNSVKINLKPEKNDFFEDSSIEIELQPESSERIVLLKAKGITNYKIIDESGVSFFGLSGDPHSLIIFWKSESVIISIGAVINEICHEELIDSDFFIEAKSIYIN